MRVLVASSIAGLVIVQAGCASHQLVRADDMSAAQHQQEAKREQAVAANADENSEAAREHARQHASAARFLEQFEDDACSGVPASGRAACPLLGPLERLEDVPGGVRVTFTDRSRVRPAIAEMRCHYAYARSRHFDANVGCPLYVKGIEVRPALDPRAVEIVARDAATTKLIRDRSREQAVFVRPRR